MICVNQLTVGAKKQKASADQVPRYWHGCDGEGDRRSTFGFIKVCSLRAITEHIVPRFAAGDGRCGCIAKANCCSALWEIWVQVADPANQTSSRTSNEQPCLAAWTSG
jgi:hypothetical protein